jgi:hypothetical protein
MGSPEGIVMIQRQVPPPTNTNTVGKIRYTIPNATGCVLDWRVLRSKLNVNAGDPRVKR